MASVLILHLLVDESHLNRIKIWWVVLVACHFESDPNFSVQDMTADSQDQRIQLIHTFLVAGCCVISRGQYLSKGSGFEKEVEDRRNACPFVHVFSMKEIIRVKSNV